jgi:hypothetical protein
MASGLLVRRPRGEQGEMRETGRRGVSQDETGWIDLIQSIRIDSVRGKIVGLGTL